MLVQSLDRILPYYAVLFFLTASWCCSAEVAAVGGEPQIVEETFLIQQTEVLGLRFTKPETSLISSSSDPRPVHPV